MKRETFLKSLIIITAACFIYGIASGIRANYGIMLDAIVETSGLPYETVSLMVAVAQLVVGIIQPVAGILALKKSNAFVLCGGAVMMVMGLVGIPFCHSALSLFFTLGIILGCGTGALAFAIIMGAITPALGEKTAAVASGFISASSGLGGTVLSPLMRFLIRSFGLRAMLLVLCVPAALLIPISLWLACVGNNVKSETIQETERASLPDLLKNSLRDRNYLHISLAFFTCGFYMAIIETHLFTQYTSYGYPETLVALAFSVYGIGAMLGCILTGFLDTLFDNKLVLGCVYASRVLIILSLLLLPKTTVFLYLTAFLFGMSGNATVPPTSGLLTKLFGAKKLATLYGIAFLIHQIGMFLSSWFGGVCVAATGSYTMIWCVSMVLSVGAALLCFSVPKKSHRDM